MSTCEAGWALARQKTWPTAFYRVVFDESAADWRDKATPGTSQRDDAKLLILRIGITVENVCNRQAIEILKHGPVTGCCQRRRENASARRSKDASMTNAGKDAPNKAGC